jgi:hypothetical protein
MNVMAQTRRGQPMPVKYWSSGGLMLTWWCNAACASCYLCCSPGRQERMASDEALAIWRGLIEASPHGCRVHLTGGEPFGDWPALIEICRRARAEGLGPLEKVETNAFWAADAGVARERLAALDAAGMVKLVISTDPYHQQFVPIERCRLAARVAEEFLGPKRLQVRWRDWLADGQDTDSLSEAERTALFARYASAGRDRLGGRAAAKLAPLLPARPVEEFADKPCRERLLRSKHVHVDPAGRVIPGTCAGIVLGTVEPSMAASGDRSIATIWRRLDADHADRPIVGRLAAGGPFALLPEARELGLVPRDGYASKCHLCWDVRRWLVRCGRQAGELAPDWTYEE